MRSLPWAAGTAARLALASVLSLCPIAGCRSEPARGDAPPEALATVQRLSKLALPTDDPRLEENEYRVLAEVARPVLTAARPFRPGLRCPPGGDPAAPCQLSVPRELPAAPAAILAFPLGEDKSSDMPDPAVTPGLAARPAEPTPSAAMVDAPREVPRIPVPAVPSPAPHDVTRLILPGTLGPLATVPRIRFFRSRLLSVPPLDQRDVETELVTVPPGAFLRFAFGVEEPAWWIDSAPVNFVISIQEENGPSVDFFRRPLDPARRPEDRRWIEWEVDLAELAGSKVRFRFRNLPVDPSDPRPSLPIWGDPRLVSPAKRPREPSIVLISLDTMRAKSMSAYGYELETTPFITSFASRGALFENAFTTFSNTLGSHMSMFTGLYPASHEVLRHPRVLAAALPTLPELLRARGYATAAFTEDALLDATRGFQRGFSYYFENKEIDVGAGDAPGTFGRALEWTGRHADERFFIFVHTYEVHAPYNPPPEYQTYFKDAGLGPGLRAYEQEIRRTDDELRRFLDGLYYVVPENDLLVVVTADHGEEFYEHGIGGHQQLYDELLRVPLIMVWPPRIPPGLRIDTPVSLVDIAPTLADLGGATVPSTMEGISLAPLLSETPPPVGRSVILAERPPNILSPEHGFVARSATEKCMLTASGEGDVCFDLERDPDEMEPLAPHSRFSFTQLHADAASYRQRSLAILADDQRNHASRRRKGADRPAESPGAEADEPAVEVETDPRIERKLRALGYVE